ncbi:hypothetical protein H6G20_25115 [Desertifilum sp. FACHB-1129]|uniref:Uncharacterized protein n=1 Tax=Desertifilum tharense IPPAS B-1220 TaxID=1781255 RepID=A0A1E5QF74_9CYAN|nr:MULTISPECIES: hypothetical protein [Desertifilum]MCD8486830.1 hypothetical protein [Desertifilum sp.]MDA0213551.1 hypothetical protein [Cyanobacteria bacterium FC1]MDI9639247.1 hypothetical protein [Geitlerinema splendidum]MBD2314953.1 hypothetical protein [Desertifilum sp. FACHB-1129]MBD2325226.1 hypothetical protein [Desertifilum sp. FACHB-866]
MNSPETPELEDRLKDLETEINIHPVVKHEPEAQPSLPSTFSKLMNWYQGLSGSGKIVTLVVVAIVGLMVIQLFVRLVAIAIGLTVLATLLYLAYKFFSNSHPAQE